MQVASQSFELWLARLKGVAVRHEQIEVITTTEAYRQRLIALIRGAQTRIYIAALYLQDDDAGRSILTELYQAKQRNSQLDIQVLVDFHRAQRGLIGKGPQVGNDQFYRNWASQYPLSPIGIYGVPVKSREFSGVLHLKGFVIDDTVVYSGASINDVYLGWHQRYRYDRYHLLHDATLADAMVRFMAQDLIGHEAVVSLLETPVPTAKSLRRSIRDFKQCLSRAEYQLAPHSGDGDISVYPLVGLGRYNNRLNQTIVRLLSSAQQRVFICTPYFNLPAPLTSAIGKLLKRGVEITIVVGDKTANDFYSPPDQPFSAVSALPYLYEQNLKRFARRHQKHIDGGRLHLQLWRCGDHSYHLKGIQVDDSCYLLTGNNLNPRAWALDLENGLLLQDRSGQLAERFSEERQCILRDTSRVTHFDAIQDSKEYPEKVAKLLKRLRRVKADLLLKRML
ncbi:CDP-diacylglycerol--serine O-phosphatidyltransferase [Ferrimonas senticii]|uniref:CDP-diacylglycerol--serine O-phosphatidyltransferase n=1 Tax=Ferrimonas senticii TaxID=394566 RepID=UPI000427541B|nr:CDP-diacylglycerol--serine O-phosphatidyltransferase [Ferrimonas senticii]